MLIDPEFEQHAFAAGHIGEQVGEDAGGGVEQLADDQGAATGGRLQQRGRGGDDRRRPQRIDMSLCA